ncbi:MAG TPA: hypothetical protein VMH38_07495 [Thermoplasmata archaeon]|nr:hypothetical protein [Thermoplasmata archaeon]
MGRGAQVFLGLFSVGFAVVVLATLESSLNGLLLLLGATVVIISAQTVLAGGRLISENWFELRAHPFWRRAVGAWGLVGLGLLALCITAFAVLDPNLAGTAAAFLLATVLVLLAFGRILQAARVSAPLWLRGSLMSTGALIVFLVVVAISFEGLALAGFAILVGVILLVTGVETVVTGLHPTDPRQFVLLKLVLFSAFYGLILINWIDLYGKSVPAYGIWLILTYMAPFGVLIVFEGWRSWPLAASLGLMVSLMNDVGYFFIGNLIFGFHENLGPWIEGQLGFLGSQVVTYFEGGSFTVTVTSWMMGLSIYARVVVVGVILYYWWRHPGAIVAYIDTSAPGAAM